MRSKLMSSIIGGFDNMLPLQAMLAALRAPRYAVRTPKNPDSPASVAALAAAQAKRDMRAAKAMLPKREGRTAARRWHKGSGYKNLQHRTR